MHKKRIPVSSCPVPPTPKIPLGFGILVPQPETKPWCSAVKVPSPNHWTAREFPRIPLFIYLFIFIFIFGCVGSSFLCEGFL